jgi:hypothetical protein
MSNGPERLNLSAYHFGHPLFGRFGHQCGHLTVEPPISQADQRVLPALCYHAQTWQATAGDHELLAEGFAGPRVSGA